MSQRASLFAALVLAALLGGCSSTSGGDATARTEAPVTDDVAVEFDGFLASPVENVVHQSATAHPGSAVTVTYVPGGSAERAASSMCDDATLARLPGWTIDPLTWTLPADTTSVHVDFDGGGRTCLQDACSPWVFDAQRASCCYEPCAQTDDASSCVDTCVSRTAAVLNGTGARLAFDASP